jgi:peptidoglycan-associated lipoprotein
MVRNMLGMGRGAGFFSAPQRGACPDTVHFAFSSHDLGMEARAVLEAQAASLMLDDGVRLLVEGHADDHGTHAYDRSLGWRRAEAVKAYLITQGIDGGRIDTVSIGRDRPAAHGSGEAAWAKNRRAVLVWCGKPAVNASSA